MVRDIMSWKTIGSILMPALVLYSWNRRTDFHRGKETFPSRHGVLLFFVISWDIGRSDRNRTSLRNETCHSKRTGDWLFFSFKNLFGRIWKRNLKGALWLSFSTSCRSLQCSLRFCSSSSSADLINLSANVYTAMGPSRAFGACKSLVWKCRLWW